MTYDRLCNFLAKGADVELACAKSAGHAGPHATKGALEENRQRVALKYGARTEKTGTEAEEQQRETEFDWQQEQAIKRNETLHFGAHTEKALSYATCGICVTVSGVRHNKLQCPCLQTDGNYSHVCGTGQVAQPKYQTDIPVPNTRFEELWKEAPAHWKNGFQGSDPDKTLAYYWYTRGEQAALRAQVQSYEKALAGGARK